MAWSKNTRRFRVWRRTVGAILLGASLCSGVPAFAEEQTSSPSSNVALQVTSWLLTAPYGTFKAAYAIGGSIVGGIIWLGTGGDTQKAKAVWKPAITGDYIIRPENLAGQRPLHFVGKTD
ncbi:MAG: hypothetical protein NNA18_04680 [Nitrospira sp.]|nr:hypothetical protein [Nitrospira sp.]